MSTEGETDTRDTLVVYGAGLNQRPLIEASRRRDLRVVAIDQNPEACSARLADRFVCRSVRDHDAIALAIAHENVSGVVARVTDPIALASAHRLARERGLPSAEPDLVLASTSKCALAEIADGASIPRPRSYHVDAAATANGHDRKSDQDEAPIDFGAYAVLVRPDITIKGKAGIHRVTSRQDFAGRVAAAASRSSNGRVDIAEWIDGSDVSVLASFDGGSATRLALFDEWVGLTSQGRITGLGVGMPSWFESSTIGPRAMESIDASLAALAKRFRASRTLLIVSFRITPEGAAHLIEIHLGPGGDGIADQLLPHALPGFDLFEAFIDAQTGEPIHVPAPSAAAHGLVRRGERWQRLGSPDAEHLRESVRQRIPRDIELPMSLGTRAPWQNRDRKSVA